MPGTPATWERALRRWGRQSLAANLRPAIRIAERGFVVDETFRSQTATNQARFAAITPTAELFLPGGDAAGRWLGVPQPRSRRHLPARWLGAAPT